MKKINTLSVFIIITAILLPMLYSCSTSCDCYKAKGCLYVTVTPYLDWKDTILSKSFCSQTNVYTQSISDSINNIFENFRNDDNIKVDVSHNIDSIYDVVRDLTEKEIKRYYKDYNCGCSK